MMFEYVVNNTAKEFGMAGLMVGLFYVFFMFMILVFILYLIMTEIIYSIWFGKFSYQHNNGINKFLIYVPLLNIVGYAKYANTDCIIAFLEIISELLMIVFSIEKPSIAIIFFLLYNIFNCYLIFKFGKKYKISRLRIFVSCLVGRFLTLENYIED